MRKRAFLLAIPAFVLVFGMMVVGCDDGNGNGGFLGETLNLSGQVWTVDWDDDDNLIWEEFKGNKTTVSTSIGGSGSITNGRLNFSIGTPSPSDLESIQSFFDDGFEEIFNNSNISPSNTRIASFYYMEVSGDVLFKGWGGDNTEEEVLYIYVDRDVTITGGGKTTTWECDCGNCRCEEWDDRCYCGSTLITRNLNLNLKTGWNAITFKWEWNESTQTETFTVSAGESSRSRWVLDDRGGHNMSVTGITESSENVKPNKSNVRSLLRSIR